MDFSRCTNVELEPRPGTRSPFDRGSSSQASSESPRGFSPDIEELERFIDSYVQEYRVEGRLNDAPNDADSERSPPPISQEEWPTDSGTWDANYVKKVCDSPWTPQDLSDSNWGAPPAQNEKPPRRSPPGLSNHGDCQKKQVPRDPSYDIWAANTNPYESSWSWCQQNDTPTVPSSILSQWDGPHDMNMRSSWQSPGVESSSTNNAKNCAPQKAVEISLYPCDGEDQTVKGESPSCRSEKSYQRPYRPPACRTGEATVAPRVDRRDNWQRPHGRRGSVGRTGGPQPQGHRIQPHSIQFWGLPQPDRSSSGWQGKRLGGRYTSREDTGSWRAGGDSERARPDGEQTPPRERHGQHSRHQPNNSMPHVTKSSPLCSSSLDDESINPPGSSSNKVQVQMPTERCTPRGCDQDGCTGVLLPAGEKSARRQPQAPVLLESSRAHLRSRFRGQLNQVESRSDPDSDRGAMQHVEDMLSQLKGCTPLSDSSVVAFLEVVSRVVTSKAQMEELVKSMLEHGMIDRAFAHSMARLCRELSGMVTSDGTRFRKLLLDQLQTEYGKRDVTQHSNVERWLGFVTLLSEVFGAMRSSDGEPFQVLILPIYTCLQELLQAQEKGEDAVLCCCLELQSIGSLLESCSPSGMTDLLSIVRDKMLDPDASLLTCSLLLEIVEVHANSWLPLTAPTATYYNRTLQKLAA